MRIQSIKCTAHYNHHIVSKCSQMASYTLTKVTAGQIAEGKRELSVTLHLHSHAGRNIFDVFL